MRVLAAAVLFLVALPFDPWDHPSAPAPAPPARLNSADIFDYPLPAWSPHCLGFGSEWRYCNGTPLRSCGSSVWLHTGVDIATPIQPVKAAGDGEIVGYLVDPVFRGGVLIRHHTSRGVVLTQYWHVWLRDGYHVGTAVKRGEVFGDVADMGDKTHLHFAVFNGDLEAHAWNGALPPSACAGFPAFPYRFLNPSVYLAAHKAPVRIRPGTL